MSLKKVALISLVGLSLAACIDVGDDDDDDDTATGGGSGGSGATTSVEASLDAAVEYMDEALPEYGSATATAYFMADTKRSLIAAAQSLSPVGQAHAAAAAVTGTANLSTYWATTTDGQLISPVGGYSNNGTETYPGTTDLVTLVNVKEYIGQQLDGSFVRESGDGGAYKPTLFGRFENSLEIVKVFSEVYPDGLVAGEKTVYMQEDSTTGNAVVTETVPSGEYMTVNMTIIDISATSTDYDMAIYVQLGSGADGDDNWMWIRNTSSELNFQHMEFKNTSETINSATVNFSRTSISTLRWDRSTGEMGFEYVSFDDDTNTQAYGNVMRAYISQTDGDAYMMAFEGDTSGDATRDTHQMFSIASTGGEAATEALVSVNMDITSNNQSNSGSDLEVNGSLCASMEDGDEIASGGCTGLDLGSIDVSTSFPAVVTNLIGVTEVSDILDHMELGTWFDDTDVADGSDLQFTDESDMHQGYTITTP